MSPLHNPPGADIEGLRKVAQGELERLAKALYKSKREQGRVVYTHQTHARVLDALENLWEILGKR